MYVDNSVTHRLQIILGQMIGLYSLFCSTFSIKGQVLQC